MSAKYPCGICSKTQPTILDLLIHYREEHTKDELAAASHKLATELKEVRGVSQSMR